MMTTLLLLYYDDYNDDDEKEREPASLFSQHEKDHFVMHICALLSPKCIERYFDYGSDDDDKDEHCKVKVNFFSCKLCHNTCHSSCNKGKTRSFGGNRKKRRQNCFSCGDQYVCSGRRLPVCFCSLFFSVCTSWHTLPYKLRR